MLSTNQKPVFSPYGPTLLLTWMPSPLIRLVIANFVLDPITYVLLKRSFKRNLTRSITELAEFLGDVRLSRKLNRQTTRVEDEAKLGNTSGFGFGHFADTSIIEVDRPRNENLVPVS